MASRRALLGVLAFAAAAVSLLPVLAKAQEFLSPGIAGCTLSTNKTVGANLAGGTMVEIPPDGTHATITPATDGIPDDGVFDIEATAFCVQSLNRVTLFAKGKVISRAVGQNDTRVSVDYGLALRPHALPSNRDYILRATAAFSVNWNRGAAGDPGRAEAGIFMSPCAPPNHGIAVAADSRAGGTAQASGSVECKVRSGESSGFLGWTIPVLMSAGINQLSGKPQEFSFEGSVVFHVLRTGKELTPVSVPGQGVAGMPLSPSFAVKVFDNDTNAVSHGTSIRFRLLKGTALVQETFIPTGPDGIATVGFVPPSSGTFRIAAFCASCVADNQATGSGTNLVFTVPVTAPVLEMAAVSAPTQAVAGQPLPEDVKVRVFVSGTETASAGISIEFRLKDAGGTVLETAQKVTGPDGIASANFTIGEAGNFTVEAFCSACGVGQTAAFSIEVEEVTALALVKDTDTDPTAGDRQKAFVGHPVPLPLRVKLQSGGRDALRAGVAIQFTVSAPPDSIGARTFRPETTTDAGGRASTILRLGSEPGEYLVRATCADCTANTEVTFIGTAKPIPTYEAGFISDFIEGPSIGIDPDQARELIWPRLGINVDATGKNPEGLQYKWEIIEGIDKVRISGLDTVSQVTVIPVRPSSFPDDVTLKVTYGPDFLGRTATLFPTFTVQEARRIAWTRKGTHDCAAFFDPKTGEVLPGVMKRAMGPNGFLIDFEGMVFDQFRQALAIPIDSELLGREEGMVVSVENPRVGLPAVGDEIDEEIHIRPKGIVPDQVGLCAKVPYPNGYSALADRCELIEGSPIQHAQVLYTGREAAISISNPFGCAQAQ